MLHLPAPSTACTTVQYFALCTTLQWSAQPCIRQCLHHALPVAVCGRLHCVLPAPSVACSSGLCFALCTPLQCHELPCPAVQLLQSPEPGPRSLAAGELQAAVRPAALLSYPGGCCVAEHREVQQGGEKVRAVHCSMQETGSHMQVWKRGKGVFGDGLTGIAQCLQDFGHPCAPKTWTGCHGAVTAALSCCVHCTLQCCMKQWLLPPSAMRVPLRLGALAFLRCG